MPEPNVIRFLVVPSPETNDHEVKIFIDGEEFIRKHWPNMMGMDPDDLLSYRHLSAQDEPPEATVVRCGCEAARLLKTDPVNGLILIGTEKNVILRSRVLPGVKVLTVLPGVKSIDDYAEGVR